MKITVVFLKLPISIQKFNINHSPDLNVLKIKIAIVNIIIIHKICFNLFET